MLSVIRTPRHVRAILLTLVVMSASAANGQTTTFTYQGQLSDAGALANNSYDLRFALFDTAAGGAQIGANQTVPAVPVSNGVFTVQLDFGVNAFPGANRFLEIGVKPAIGGSFTTLAPRQQISSSPYAIRTLSAATADALSSACVGCVQDAQIQSVTGSKVSGAIPVASLPAGSANYIQNTTTTQAGTNFNVGGNGTIGGMLGIGTSTPASKLAVQTATGLYGFTHTDGTITVGSYVGGSGSGATGGWLGTRSNHQLHLFTNNGQPSLTIDTTGNVGIGTTTPSAGSRLEVNGTLSSNIVKATTQYDLGDDPVLSAAGESNLFVGLGAGQANTTGERNAFVGAAAGQANTTGGGNAFVGASAGRANTTGELNAFVGLGAGLENTTGERNAFVGAFAGLANTTGKRNAFVGAAAGLANTTGEANAFVGASAGEANTTGGGNAFVGVSAGEANTEGGLNTFVGAGAGLANTTGERNAFVGYFAGGGNTIGVENAFVGVGVGSANTTGEENAFVGFSAGTTNTTGNRNTIVGAAADVGATNLTNATAIGADAQVDQSDALVLGSVAGINSAASSVNVGIGTTTPQARLHVKGDTLVETSGSGGNIQFGTPNGETGMTIINRQGTTSRVDMRFDGSTLKLVASTGGGPPAPTSGIAITSSGNVGIGQTSPLAKLDVAGTLKVDTLAGGGSEPLCRNSVFHTIATCSSSRRYKQQIAPYSAGLDLINRLQPISFSWKADGRRDLGLGAEDVATVEPLLVTRNDKGEIEGVKYDHLNVVLINAIKQQQSQIEALRAATTALNARLRAVEKGMGNSNSGMNDFMRSN